MEPIFTDKQLNNMSREDLISLMKIVQEQTKKKDTEIQLLKDKQKELEFLNAMLSDRLTPCTEETVWCIQRKVCRRL